MKRWYEAFSDGYKPAVLLDSVHPYFDRLKKYPHITPFDQDQNSYIFFQTDEAKKDYAQKMNDIEWDFGSYDCHYHAGVALGFPERSVAEYAQWRVIEQKVKKYPEKERQKSIGIIWAGFFFSSYLDFVIEEIRWLWKTYDHPKAINHMLNMQAEDVGIEIQYGDFNRLNEVCEYIRQKRGLVPTVTNK